MHTLNKVYEAVHGGHVRQCGQNVMVGPPPPGVGEGGYRMRCMRDEEDREILNRLAALCIVTTPIRVWLIDGGGT